MLKTFRLKTDKIHNCYKIIATDEHNRYDSWKHCFETFGNLNQDDDYLALHLGFYLASWGMYRGSAALLQKSYKIHIGAVKILKENKHLRCNFQNEVSKDDIELVLSLYKQLYNYYLEFSYFDKNSSLGVRKPTDTLISKIILGTLGCRPAFDRYFNDGVKKYNFGFTKFTNKSFDEVFIFIELYKSELSQLQAELLLSEKIHYPLLKLVDIFFWHEGFNTETNKKKFHKWQL